jgi:hypothetical protein
MEKRILIAGNGTIGASCKSLMEKKERGIIIVGDRNDDISRRVAEAAIDDRIKAEVIVLGDNKTYLNIDGKLYEETEKTKINPYSHALPDFIREKLDELKSIYNYKPSYQRERPEVDLICEFRLIQEKRSKLSRSDREWVVRQFNSKFKEVKE